MRFGSLAVGRVLAVATVPIAPAAERSAVRRPNIVYSLGDDLGYGDVRCFNARGRIATPHHDGLAAAGVRFTNAHSSSAVCTPTRYGILTGRYNWRSALKSGVLSGDSNRLIEPGRLAATEFLRHERYRTACVGSKWHLGLDWARKEGDRSKKLDTGWDVHYSAPIAEGPLTVGFDDYFGISASLDMSSYLFIRGDRARDSDGRESRTDWPTIRW